MPSAEAPPWVATYRLQLSPAFTFREAAAAVPYLSMLGISHLYLSPVWECAAGSEHGYDVTDHGQVRAEIGGMAGFMELRAAATAHGLGIVVDIVPNHVGIGGGQNPWWNDVLRFGEASEHAAYFDIDWDTQPELPSGIVVLPVLGRPYGEALEAGEIVVAYDGAEAAVRYYGETFPLAPSTYGMALGTPAGGLAEELRDPGAYTALIATLESLRSGSTEDARAAVARLSRMAAAEPAVRSWIDGQLAGLSGVLGAPSSWDALDALLTAQHYRLAYWRVSGDEINYRRFFDINGLAAVRQEHPAAFDATHALLARMIDEGLVQGVRVDHVDGLFDPGGYLEKLAALAPDHPAPIWVEKVLAHGESLPAWPVAGTTGYDFLAAADSVFVAPGAEAAMTRLYQEFTGDSRPFEVTAAEAKFEVAEDSFAGEVSVLALQLFRLAQRDRRFRDVTRRAFRDALEALLAALPVYRTYLEGDVPAAGDRALVEAAAQTAVARDPHLAPQAVRFLVDVLLLDSDRIDDEESALWRHFRRRFQQISGPVMAKGVEDTAFYRYVRLLALNEVGGDPGRWPAGTGEFHRWAADRALAHPLSLSATSTHDTKRSEDARMRLAVLSEDPAGWRREARAWSRLNAKHRTALPSGEWVPGPRTEYYLYQTLVASFESGVSPEYIDRIAGHMIKAAREAGLHTSWTEPNEPYEKALGAFTGAALDARLARRFLGRLGAFVSRIEPAARLNSLGLVVLKCLAPGVPDIYQGCEFPSLMLTDPDNRQPVDFEAARQRLDSISAECPPGSSDRKPWLLQRLLRLRAEMPALFAEGGYEAIEAEGPSAAQVLAFARTGEQEAVAAAIPRLVWGHIGPEGCPELAAGTSLQLPPGYRWNEAFSGRAIGSQSRVDLATRLLEAPVAVFRGVRP